MLVTLLLTALVALDVDAGPQPGDTLDPTPVLDGANPALLDAGPALQDAGPVPILFTPSAEGAAPLPVDAVPLSDPDATRAAATQPTPTVQPSEPVVQTAPSRTDPDSVPLAGPTPTPPVLPPLQHPAGLGFGGVPAINFDSDNGFGFGVVATLYSYDGQTRPYRAALTLQVFMTSKLVQDHNLALDWLKVADLPLRLYTRVGYQQSFTQNYCGLGGDVSCDPKEAERAATGPDGVLSEELARHFYLRRFINPYGLLQSRWALVTTPQRFELTAGYRGFYFIPGTWDDEDKDGKADLFPYPGSLYARDHPDGEPGFDSSVQLGLMLDSRDNEPAPTEGVWVEASVRTSSPLIGSSWTWSGANLTLRSYAPLTDDHRLVLANRFVVDAVIGDPPVQELARAGGSSDYYIYGGSVAGRGIRAQRYLGKVRGFNQTELRWSYLEVDALGQQFGLGTGVFIDLGVVGNALGDLGATPALPGFGWSGRLAWNENFIVRLDVGFSPIEDYAPSLYILIGNSF